MALNTNDKLEAQANTISGRNIGNAQAKMRKAKDKDAQQLAGAQTELPSGSKEEGSTEREKAAEIIASGIVDTVRKVVEQAAAASGVAGSDQEKQQDSVDANPEGLNINNDDPRSFYKYQMSAARAHVVKALGDQRSGWYGPAKYVDPETSKASHVLQCMMWRKSSSENEAFSPHGPFHPDYFKLKAYAEHLKENLPKAALLALIQGHCRDTPSFTRNMPLQTLTYIIGDEKTPGRPAYLESGRRNAFQEFWVKHRDLIDAIVYSEKSLTLDRDIQKFLLNAPQQITYLPHPSEFRAPSEGQQQYLIKRNELSYVKASMMDLQNLRTMISVSRQTNEFYNRLHFLGNSPLHHNVHHLMNGGFNCYRQADFTSQRGEELIPLSEYFDQQHYQKVLEKICYFEVFNSFIEELRLELKEVPQPF